MELGAAMAWRRGQALGQDLRDRVLADAGRPARAVAARFEVSVWSDQAWSTRATLTQTWPTEVGGKDPFRRVFIAVSG
jgi:hypothetical protein